ncbi:unnamed protein product [Heligmosomoides polygyrus]|uniref:Phosphatidylinositol kinase n=1 Tax=Heligmosomoides polygyrus TaxID=6339 RepID=A0A183FG67_HELPZ|nr:unnamed protein product [Heligmosomoides polygyrus]
MRRISPRHGCCLRSRLPPSSSRTTWDKGTKEEKGQSWDEGQPDQGTYLILWDNSHIAVRGNPHAANAAKSDPGDAWAKGVRGVPKDEYL